MTFSEAVVTIMERDGITQADLCKRAGISDAYASMLCNGKVVDPKWSRAEVIIEALGVSLDEFSAIRRSNES